MKSRAARIMGGIEVAVSHDAALSLPSFRWKILAAVDYLISLVNLAARQSRSSKARHANFFFSA